MLPELRVLFLGLALAASLLQVRGGWADIALERQRFYAGLQLAGCLGAFGVLLWTFAASDFSVLIVAENSHTTKPLIYKLSGAWGNHEGSALMWALIHAFYAFLYANTAPHVSRATKQKASSIIGALNAPTLLFILAASNPFERLAPAALEGQGLNPLLQDPALAIHPPILYAGYVGFVVPFGIAAAAILSKSVNRTVASEVLPWGFSALALLTLGVGLGSWWAYRELGWGGWWFWDPVENASFMPWLAGTALLHSAIVMEKREGLKVWTVLLAIITFALSLLGTFLVRSGVLTSVHAFATDPERGLFILIIMIAFVGGAFALFAWRAPLLRNGGVFSPISREGALVLNNLFLSVACAAVLIGTLYPLALEAVTGQKISVGPPFFNATFLPLMIPLLLVLPFGPFLAWKRADVAGAAERLLAAGLFAVLGAVMAASLAERGPWLAPIGVALGLWLIAGAASEIAFRTKLFKVDLSETWRRACNLPRSAWGTAIAHAGVGVTVLGVVGETAWKDEYIGLMRPGDQTEIADHMVTLESMRPHRGPNYVEDVARFEVTTPDGLTRYVEASKRLYPARNFPTTEAGMIERLAGDLYVTLGEPQEDGTQTVRVFYKPLVNLIWIGTLFMIAGGTVSLTDRRLRVGAPVPAKARRRAEVSAIPAE
ncbi:MAG: heme lyase CcmF/NrfE family subunit [Hyphomicrobiales bacterium]|nr:heme lyase CcmF/NrfE family subunit [Hyphomicrobiales bacterium]